MNDNKECRGKTETGREGKRDGWKGRNGTGKKEEENKEIIKIGIGKRKGGIWRLNN